MQLLLLIALLSFVAAQPSLAPTPGFLQLRVDVEYADPQADFGEVSQQNMATFLGSYLQSQDLAGFEFTKVAWTESSKKITMTSNTATADVEAAVQKVVLVLRSEVFKQQIMPPLIAQLKVGSVTKVEAYVYSSAPTSIGQFTKSPTKRPSASPTASPTKKPSLSPTPFPTKTPTMGPVVTPTPASPKPTIAPTDKNATDTLAPTTPIPPTQTATSSGVVLGTGLLLAVVVPCLLSLTLIRFD
mmetsp:Transcript_3456/g.6558  ORF Transcript_3456/g.6558 Transcript_3456/m.6558 type:complete len:243 (-) Transcript_3456:22-750(-)